MNQKVCKAVVISDGTGETATAMARAAITQFPNQEIIFTRHKNVSTVEEIESIIKEASIHHHIILYTIVSPDLRNKMIEFSKTKNIMTYDLMGPLIDSLSIALDSQPVYKPGVLHVVDTDYYKKIEALEFTLQNDDSGNFKKLDDAEIILIGISRTSKTPLSIFLSLEGLKVINITLHKDQGIPKEILEIDQRKIYALTIKEDILLKFREKKALKNKAPFNKTEIIDELKWSEDSFKNNIRWPVFDISHKTLEETSSEIKRLYQARSKSLQKQNKRY